MNILSHRGYWLVPEEKNTPVAFERALCHGFGIETDIREFNGELVISHDIATKGSQPFSDFLSLYSHFSPVTLALNIKADGLQSLLYEALIHYGIQNYFVFDMAVPDGLLYFNHGFNVFTRQSEQELIPSFYYQAQGVWMDCFLNDWATPELIDQHTKNGKKVCIVSPELHKRPYLDYWLKLSNIKTHDIMLCTDVPREAYDFFNDSN